MASVRKKEPKMRDYRFATFISSLLYPIITTTPWLMITIFVRKDDIDLSFSRLTAINYHISAHPPTTACFVAGLAGGNRS